MMDIELKSAKVRQSISGYDFRNFSCETRKRNGEWEWRVAYSFVSNPEGESIVKDLVGEEAGVLFSSHVFPKKLSDDLVARNSIEIKQVQPQPEPIPE
jgi:hypothetical protein